VQQQPHHGFQLLLQLRQRFLLMLLLLVRIYGNSIRGKKRGRFSVHLADNAAAAARRFVATARKGVTLSASKALGALSRVISSSHLRPHFTQRLPLVQIVHVVAHVVQPRQNVLQLIVEPESQCMWRGALVEIAGFHKISPRKRVFDIGFQMLGCMAKRLQVSTGNKSEEKAMQHRCGLPSGSSRTRSARCQPSAFRWCRRAAAARRA
jgi:hypothetical protein